MLVKSIIVKPSALCVLIGNDLDNIPTEGYKHGPWPKIAIFRAESGKGLAIPAEECIAVVTDTPLEVSCPQFPLDAPAPMAEFLAERFLSLPSTKEEAFL